MKQKKVVVIGAGVNGLSAAVKVAEYYLRENVSITLVSDQISPNTTGDGSAGLWGPYYCGITPDDKIVQWSRQTHDFFHKLWFDGLAEEVGIIMIPVYRLTTEAQGYPEPSWKDIVHGYRNLSTRELEQMSVEHDRKYTGGSHFVSYCCEPTKFLPYLFKRFLAAGGCFENRKVENFDEFSDSDLVINCTGLGSKELANDSKSHPIRGQVARVEAPWAFEVMLDDSDDGNYVIPNSECVILGGTHQMNDYNTNISPKDNHFIYSGTRKMLKSLVNAPSIKEWVGLRPGREMVRLETETKRSKNHKKTSIIHNYGHGGCGVTLCWGCADEVLEKTVTALDIPQLSSKL
ncbi:unnamed protein product [Diamesa serratosioi]